MTQFKSSLNQYFTDPEHRWLKPLVAAIVVASFCAASAARTTLRNNPMPGSVTDSLPNILGVALGGGLVGGLLGAVLVLRDITTERLATNQPVNFLLKLCLGPGAFSLVLWSVLIGGIVLAALVVLMPI